MNEKIYIVDSFTNEPFKGNPAGVQLVNQPLDVERMQQIARELNFSETAFVVTEPVNADGPIQQFSIRFFSPKMEIPLCGHGTLASAKVMFGLGLESPIQFRTIENRLLTVRQIADRIEMELPVYDLEPAETSCELLTALGVEDVVYAGYNSETNILMLEIESAEKLAKLKPAYHALINTHKTIHGLSVTARGAEDFDFHSRFFWPWSGGEEDPVTGGTHTFLAKYWSEKLGKKKLRSFQASARTGRMEVEITDDQRLLIRGQAITVLDGTLRV